jgi:hypothetical protein
MIPFYLDLGGIDEENSDLFNVLRQNESFDFRDDQSPPVIEGDLHEFSLTTHESWFFAGMVDKNGYPWDPSQAGEDNVIIFVFAISEGRGTSNQRVVIPYIYNPSISVGIDRCPGYWTGLSRPLCYYRDFHRETDRFCGTGDCHCLKCTAAKIIQRRYLRWKHDQVYCLLTEIFQINFGHDVPVIVDKIMNYYINM